MRASKIAVTREAIPVLPEHGCFTFENVLARLWVMSYS